MNTYMKQSGELALLLTAVIFGTFGIFAKELSAYFSAVHITFILNSFQTIFFLVWVWGRKEWFNSTKMTSLPRLFFFAIANALPMFFFTNAVRFLPIGAVLLIQNTITLFTSMVIEFYSQRKKPTIHEVSYIIISIISIAIIYLPFTIGSIYGVCFAVGVGLFNAVTNSFRQSLSSSYSSQQLALASSITGGLMWGTVALFTPISGVASSPFTIIPLLLLLGYSLLNVCTTFLLNKGFATVPLTIGNAILLFEIVIGYTLGRIFFGEIYGMYQIAGSLTLLTTITALRLSPPQDSYSRTSVLIS